jgi:hypothetical protein
VKERQPTTKKLITLLLALATIFSLCACGVGGAENTVQETKPEEITLLQEIEQAETIEAINDCDTRAKTDEEKAAVLSKWKEIMCASLSGYYYNREPMTNALKSYIGMGNKYKLEDNRAVYMKSEQEVYFMPYSERELTEMGLTLKDIPGMENSQMYCYSLSGVDRSGLTATFTSLYVDESAYEDYREITLWWDVEDGYVLFYDYFPDETTEAGQYTEDNSVVFTSREYYSSEESAIIAKQEREGETAAYNEENDTLKESNPKIGMTADEVKKCAWGYPDEINKDTYSWGVKEQWVYDDYGYVYLEDGVVTSVSER